MASGIVGVQRTGHGRSAKNDSRSLCNTSRVLFAPYLYRIIHFEDPTICVPQSLPAWLRLQHTSTPPGIFIRFQYVIAPRRGNCVTLSHIPRACQHCCFVNLHKMWRTRISTGSCLLVKEKDTVLQQGSSLKADCMVIRTYYGLPIEYDHQSQVTNALPSIMSYFLYISLTPLPAFLIWH